MRNSLALVMVAAFVSTASAQQRPPQPPPCKPGLVRDHGACVARAPKQINIDNPLELGGRIRALSLLQFIERANDELERTSLEKQSFLPRLVQTVDDSL